MSLETKLSSIGRFLDRFFKRVSQIVHTSISPKNDGTNHDRMHRKQPGIAAPYAILIFDSFVAFLSIFISIHLRIGMDFLDYSPTYIIKNMFVFGLISSSVFLWIQTHMSFWKYTSIDDVISLFLAVILSNIFFFPLMMLMNQEDFLPYSVLIINTFVLTIMLSVPRLISRMLYNRKTNLIRRLSAEDLTKNKNNNHKNKPYALLIGRAQSVENFLREFFTNKDIDINFYPVGILSPDISDKGMAIRGIPILGETRNIGKILRSLRSDNMFPSQMIVTERDFQDSSKRLLLSYSKEYNIKLTHVVLQCIFEDVSEGE